MVFCKGSALAPAVGEEQAMPRRFHECFIVDHQFVLGHTHRDTLAQQSPGDRVKVLAVDHEAFGVDAAVAASASYGCAAHGGDQLGPFLGMTKSSGRALVWLWMRTSATSAISQHAAVSFRCGRRPEACDRQASWIRHTQTAARLSLSSGVAGAGRRSIGIGKWAANARNAGCRPDRRRRSR